MEWWKRKSRRKAASSGPGAQAEPETDVRAVPPSSTLRRFLMRACSGPQTLALQMISSLAWSVPRASAFYPFPILAAALHLVLTLALIHPLKASAERQAQVVEPCNIAFYLPNGFSVMEQTKTSLLARNAAGMELAIFCTFNESRTYDPGRIIARPGVKEIKPLHMEGEIQGLLYSNTRFSGGKKMQSIEAYIATRNLEYRVIAIPSGGTFDEKSQNDARDLVEELLAGLSWIAPPDATISEEQYRLRLWIASGVGVAILGLIGLYFWKRKKG